jgi:metallo-beta-lactamase family protein
MNGQKTLRIKDVEHTVLANVEKIDVFSGHGDQNDLIEFVKKQPKEKLKKVFLIHGELESMEVFKGVLEKDGYQGITIPEYGQTFEL